ncbi:MULTISPECIES: GntR family transcriptional regulator [Streptomyces]|uniref:GntR family transcriptional regulator n=2 Tax=Streptomyces caniscabiei TaxID=2746961 RepID=A0ABU4MLB2_9ACTN|nr:MULTISPECIES: GntR family transcriptional regulator [Streptomyces]MBE4739235.1 GntR family transcriptional regulator [Streptomyces caniscabiei]MBE4758618.1 GntR family transcriptional regulator [Streptomyces caniscabiei]MBE4771832.1 GntR family transcriptional regulator [Streptomyces caniscabiei]MBE4787893.1 GntR family transcriptional regulator [Streptomyces caniscabiei]MBE4797115.1 GntR family transcriptional regulator [Streptomyces caniscabiei]
MGTQQLETVPEPKYWHLKTVLSEALDSEFSVGEILPNERDLAARFGVARATLRQALEQLELEGRLQRRRGVGTTVAPPRVGVAVGTEQRAWPGTVGDTWQAVDCTASAPPAAVADLLDSVHGEQVHVVRRSRMSHGQPVAAELLYVPAASVPALSGIDAPSGAARARAVLRELQRLELEGQDRSVELGSARADDAKELDRLPGAPVLVVTTRFFAEGRTAAVSLATYRADTCRLTFGASGGVEIHHGPERRAS